MDDYHHRQSSPPRRLHYRDTDRRKSRPRDRPLRSRSPPHSRPSHHRRSRSPSVHSEDDPIYRPTSSSSTRHHVNLHPSTPIPKPPASLNPPSSSLLSGNQSITEFVADDEASLALSQPFVWGKKKKRDKKLGRFVEDFVDPTQFREELSLLASRRAQREVEKKLRDEERVQAQRDADRAQFGDWEAREDDFQLKQAHSRAQIRIKQGRSEPIDLLSATLQIVTNPDVLADDVVVRTREPYRILEHLPYEDLLRVGNDIEMYLWLEKNPDHIRFWTCLRAVYLYILQRIELSESDRRVAQSVYQEIEHSLMGKTLDQLVELEDSVQQKLKSNEPMDLDYWEVMLDLIKVSKAKSVLDDYHCKLLAIQAEYRSTHKIKDEQHTGHSLEPTDASGTPDNGEPNADYTPESFSTENPANKADFGKHAAQEISLENRSYNWALRYRPRKPKYVNRVNTGYEWNKYNQTHYDSDNPPPKVVQGYKFNIFYPDLLDRSKAPTYRLEPKPNGSKDTVILKFMAGPPYEDIAFEIINKEWEMSHTRGFRCTFDRGVLQLHFQFRRYFYRK